MCVPSCLTSLRRRSSSTQRGDRAIPVGIAHYIAEHIPNAELCLLDTEDHLFWFSEAIDEISEAVQGFLNKFT